MKYPSVRVVILALAMMVTALGCGGRQRAISGTRIADTSANRELIDIIEAYRQAVERGDAPALMLMASNRYWEDSGTPTGSDDYGIDGLRQVLQGRFAKASDIRYSMRYVSIRKICPDGSGGDLVDGCRAHIEVLIDASFTILDAHGQERRPDKRDQNELVLEWTCHQVKPLHVTATPPGAAQPPPQQPAVDGGCKWLFVSGM